MLGRRAGVKKDQQPPEVQHAEAQHGFAKVVPPLLRGRWRYVSLLFGLFLFTAILEGFGFSLVIPLLQTILPGATDPGGSNLLQRGFASAMERVPSEWRTGGLLALFVVVFLVKSLGMIASAGFARWFVDRLRMDWSTRCFLAYVNAPYAKAVGRSHGEIVQNIIGETNQAASGVLLVILFAARSIQIFVLTLVLLLANWQATIFFLLLAAIGFALTWRSTRVFSLGTGRVRQRIRRQVSEIVNEAINGLRTVKLLEIGGSRAKRLKKILYEYAWLDTKFEVLSGLPSNVKDLLAVIAGCGVIGFMTMVLGLNITEVLPTLSLFGVIFVPLLRAVSDMFAKIAQITTSLPPLNSVYQNLREPPEQLPGGAPLSRISGDIKIEDIVLRPTGRQKIFDGLTLVIPPVGLTAIVGPSGSGKTTLVDLIVRLREPDSGRIFINGRDIREFEVRSLRSRISYMSQEVQLFNGTVAENLRFGRADASDTELVEAVKRAHAYEFIAAMPQGFESPLGRGGVMLSGGQRQRLSLARELLRDPDLYIFDEPTSALDRDAEVIIGELINELSKTHPVIIISHRPDVIFGARIIYRIENGKAVEVDVPGFAKVKAAP